MVRRRKIAPLGPSIPAQMRQMAVGEQARLDRNHKSAYYAAKCRMKQAGIADFEVLVHEAKTMIIRRIA